MYDEQYQQSGYQPQGFTDEPYEYEPYEKPTQPRRNSGARQPSNSRA